MKNETELQGRLLAELKQWFVKQCRNPFGDYYLYYLAATAEHAGGIIICADTPANPKYQLALGEKIRKECTVEQNFNWIRRGILRTLPVLR